MNILEVNDLRKVYTTRFGGQSVEALRAVTFAVEEGEFVAVMGESGSGKTTLLNILAALDKPTSGQVLLEGKDIVKGKEADMAAFRRDHLGFVFQDFNLLDTFTLEDNIYLPLVLAGKKYPEMHRALLPLAEQLGIHLKFVCAMDRRVCAVSPTAMEQLLYHLLCFFNKLRLCLFITFLLCRRIFDFFNGNFHLRTFYNQSPSHSDSF